MTVLFVSARISQKVLIDFKAFVFWSFLSLIKAENPDRIRFLGPFIQMEKAQSGKSRIRIKIRAYDSKLIDQSAKQIVETAKRSGASVHGPLPLPTERKRYTVLKSTFVHKDSREQFEMRTHKRLIDILDANPKTVDALTNLNLPAGVDVEIKMS